VVRCEISLSQQHWGWGWGELKLNKIIYFFVPLIDF